MPSMCCKPPTNIGIKTRSRPIWLGLGTYWWVIATGCMLLVFFAVKYTLVNDPHVFWSSQINLVLIMTESDAEPEFNSSWPAYYVYGWSGWNLLELVKWLLDGGCPGPKHRLKCPVKDIFGIQFRGLKPSPLASGGGERALWRVKMTLDDGRYLPRFEPQDKQVRAHCSHLLPE